MKTHKYVAGPLTAAGFGKIDVPVPRLSGRQICMILG